MICRLCFIPLSESDAFYLFKNSGRQARFVLVDLIAKHLHLELSGFDCNSTCICSYCADCLESFHGFYIHVEKKQNSLPDEIIVLDIVSEQITKDHVSCVKYVPPIEQVNTGLLNVMVDVANGEEQDSIEIEEEFENRNIKETFVDSVETAGILPTVAKGILQKDISKKRKKEKISEAELRSKPKNNHENEANEKPNVADGDVFIAQHIELKCELCGTTALTFHKLTEHFKNAHNQRGYITCCEKRIKSRPLLLEHLKWHVDPSYLQCQICKKTLACRKHLNQHIQAKHSNGEEFKHVCVDCGARFLRAGVLKSHRLLKHQNHRKFPCTMCEKVYQTRTRLNRHVVMIHDNVIVDVCEICGRTFNNGSHFRFHMEQHQGNKPLECTICGKLLKNKVCLRTHIKRCHTVTKQVQCKRCKKVCRSETLLRIHIRTIHDAVWLKCQLCGKSYRNQAHLRDHMTSHTGEMLHKCDYCGKEFRTGSNKYTHIKKHHYTKWLEKQEAKYRRRSESRNEESA